MTQTILDMGIDARSGYGEVDVVRMFLLISERPVGRRKLVERLMLGEATVKTMIKLMKSCGFISQGTRGVYPSKRGFSVFSRFRSFSQIRHAKLKEFPSDKTAVIKISGCAGKMDTGIIQRDEGVKHDSTVISLMKMNGRIDVIGCPEYPHEYSGIIESVFDVDDGDVVILSSAESMLDAERGAVSAAMSTVA